MRRSSALALAAACATAPLLWASSASADSYPPTGPTGGGGSFTGGGGTVTSTVGGGSVTPTLPHTGTDLRTPALAGGASLVTGTVLLVAFGRRRRSASA